MSAALTTTRPRLVMLRALGLGDFLTAVPAYRAIARAFPGHHRTLAAPIALAPLARLCGGIDAIVDTSPLASIDPELHACDVAINLHGSGPQSHRVLLETEPTRLLAFANDDAKVEGPRFETDEHEVVRWCRMLRAFGIVADPAELDLRVAPRHGSYGGRILLHPGAAYEARRWPVERWIALIAALRRDGHRVALTGTADEFRLCRVIARNAGLDGDDVLAGRTTLDDLAALVAGARALICGDTGVAHLATALGTPSVVLFGPMSPARWGPPRERARHHAIWHGRTGDPHASSPDPGLVSIGVDEVVQRLRDVLSLRPAG